VLPTSRPNVTDGWLPYVLPEAAATFRIGDRRLAGSIVDAGGTLVERNPDVEIMHAPLGDARMCVVALGYPRSESGRLRAAADRIVRAGQVRVGAEVARRRIGSAYRHVQVVGWDLGYSLPIAERLPLRALDVGRNGTADPTIHEAVARAAGLDGEAEAANAREGFLLVPAGERILRLAVGPGRCEPLNQKRALEALAALDPPGSIASIVPWLDSSGRTGLADWTVERRLRGDIGKTLTPNVHAQCLDFLAALQTLPCGAPKRAADDAERVAAFVPAEAGELRALAQRVDLALEGHPHGFAHGDFWAGNVLVEDGAISGVIDWASAGAGRPALLDLAHLLLIGDRRPSGHDWGTAIDETLLPMARNEDERLAAFARRVGVELTRERLVAVVAAYWFDRLAYQLESFGDRVDRPLWLRNNLTSVLRELAPLA
jgi:aminoglycoside phosphotransferase (APT) family kinase protein